MKIESMEITLVRLAELIRQGRFEELETDTLEFKPTPSEMNGWKECHKSACAFLNTRGGILILGIKEEGTGPARKYEFTGWLPHAENGLKEMPKQFTQRLGAKLNLNDAFPPPMLVDFMDGKLAVQLVDELPADQKYVFYRGKAYRRHITGDHEIQDSELDRQEEFKEEASQARELQPVQGVNIQDLDLDKLNDYITQLNRPVKIETVKPSLEVANAFLERKGFIRNGAVTTLGVLVCGAHPEDLLGFRCQVHGYVDVPQEIARDKQDFAENVLPLMEHSLAYLLRNIQVGVALDHGGIRKPQYPESLLRETVNNALAHRDYSINRHIVLAIKPGQHIAIQNPGSFRNRLLIEETEGVTPLRRIIPEAKPRNPKLADVLRVFRKWEGRGIGMATMVNLCLHNEIDLPYYHFGTEEVTLHLCCGRLVDERMERLFKAFDRYISEKLSGGSLTEAQKTVLTYLIKSEWANELVRYTILLTPDNNHFNELLSLERFGLITKHSSSTGMYPIYVVDRTLVQRSFLSELRNIVGTRLDSLDDFHKQVLQVVYRFNTYSLAGIVSAKVAAQTLWAEYGNESDIKAFDTFYRKVRYAFNRLQKGEFVSRKPGTHGYLIH